jgi:transposase
LPARIEDYVSADNPVRAIEAYVGSLDLAKLGFGHAAASGGAGQPPYDPADLLKLYLYGYVNHVRSSRRLERETQRNLEVIWLLRGLTPGYRTIGNFRKDNVAALKAANRGFVLLARQLDLLGGELVAIDGAFFHGDASKASIVTGTRLGEQLSAVEREIEAYSAALEINDRQDEMAAEGPAPCSGAELTQRLAGLRERQAAVEAEQAKLAASSETQLSRTDPDARRLAKNGQVVAGYNVQIAVDAKHHLIVSSEVVNDGNDTGQLHAMAAAAKAALGVETLDVVADCGYCDGANLKACEEQGITAYVPLPERGAGRGGRFGVDEFHYDAATDRYHCPAGRVLAPMAGEKRYANGRVKLRYVSHPAKCRSCPLRQRCLSPKATRREIERWVHQDVIDRHRIRMQTAEAIVRRRKAIVEHPFGTLKCRAGYQHFLLRGFRKVRGEWSLMALCYNFTRVLNILGLTRFLACLALSLYCLTSTMARLPRIPCIYRIVHRRRAIITHPHAPWLVA